MIMCVRMSYVHLVMHAYTHVCVYACVSIGEWMYVCMYVKYVCFFQANFWMTFLVI